MVVWLEVAGIEGVGRGCRGKGGRKGVVGEGKDVTGEVVEGVGVEEGGGDLASK